MLDVNDLTLEEVNEEFDKTLDKLERLSKLREAMLEQDHRRIEKLVAEYHTAQRRNREVKDGRNPDRGEAGPASEESTG
jgi:beta-glucosidase-like glycosyl hydrolase